MKTERIFALALGLGIAAYVEQQRYNKPKIFYRKRLINNYNALTIPAVGIFIKESEKNNKALLQHELIHWQQFQKEGLIPFAINYGLAAIDKGYDANPYEQAARVDECEYCKKNYTQCVRNGTAKTVSNPNFRKE